jgi:tetratricopeptide (TPR) repeat protein
VRKNESQANRVKGSGPDTVEASLEVVREMDAALRSGRIPRGGRPLQQAAGLLREACRHAEAVQALLTLARLEMRREDPGGALRRARAALRLARESGVGADPATGLLIRLHRRAGDVAKARSLAEEWLGTARDRGDSAAAAAALLRLAECTPDPAEAAVHLSDADHAASRSGCPTLQTRVVCRTSALLLCSGCPTAANDLLTPLARQPADTEQAPRVLLARGWSALTLGRAPAAARDFRKSRGLAREQSDPFLELRSTAGLAAALAGQAAENGGADSYMVRARSVAAQARRQSRRLRDRQLTTEVEEVLRRSVGGEPDPAPSVRDAARRLVDLAARTSSQTLVDACVREVERMGRLDPAAPAYAWWGPYPLPLD